MTEPAAAAAAAEPATPAAAAVTTPEAGSLIDQAVAAAVAAQKAGPTEDDDTVVIAEPEPVAEPAKAAEPAGAPLPVPDPAQPAVDSDEKLAKMFARISGIEAERQKERGELAALRVEAARAKEYDDSFAKFRSDPQQLFERVGWDAETISAYIKGDPTPVRQAAAETAAEKKFAAMEARLTELTATIQKEREGQIIQQLRNQLPGLLQGPGADKFPTSAVFFRAAPHEFSDAVMATVSQARASGKELSYEEAATAVENVIRSHKERFLPDPAGATGTKSAPVSQKPAATAATTLTNAATPAPSSQAVDPDAETPEARLKRAEAQLKLLKRP